MESGAVNLTDGLSRWARKTPAAPAVEDESGNVLTYAQLEELSRRMAGRLRESGVRPGDRVGFCLPKSINSVVTVFGALRAGAAYVPVGVSSPPQRNRFIFDDCAARVVVTDETWGAPLRQAAGDSSCDWLVFPGDAAAAVGAPWLESAVDEAPPEAAGAGSYILYTSGSTGVPKGVAHTHASAMSFVRWSVETLQPRADDRFSSHAPFHFDLSILDLYVPIQVGSSVVLIGEALGKEPRRLARFIAEREISVWYSTPSILSMLAQFGRLEQFDFSPLRHVLFAGEVFPVKHLRRLKHHWPHPAYFNLYGPTETNVCTYYRLPDTLDEQRTSPYPIGQACSNVRARVLDDDLADVEDGGEGILYIHDSGPTMRGYWSSPEKSAEAFHVDADGERWYRTGDVVRRNDDGDYVYLGRRDRMVKRHGYRIELDEIEAGVYRHPDVREAAVIARDGADGPRITAYLSLAGERKPSIVDLKQHCAEHLPPYMSPDHFSFLARLPRTSTNKVDYQALLRSDS